MEKDKEEIILNWEEVFNKKKLYKVEKKIAKIKNIPVYPSFQDRYQAFKLTKLQNVKVVIIGQDPYYSKNQANGLAFSVNKNVKIPPSLKNIFKEIKNDLGISIPKHGDLSYWAKQGVLLINTALSVEENKPMSHYNLWKPFTISLLKEVLKVNPIFLVWGKKAQEVFNEVIKKESNLDLNVLFTTHPSPLSANKGFFGCKHFSKCNEILTNKNLTPIDWNLNNE